MTTTVNLWHGELADDLSDHPHLWALLDSTELIQARNIKNERQQHRYVQTHGLLRALLAKIIHTKPDVIKIGRGQYGKPYLPDYPEWTFNLSHSDNYLVMAIAQDCHLGVDVEICKDRKNFVGLVDKCFAESEATYWRQLSSVHKTREFYRFWTAKEAFVKATGRGISLGLKQCVLDAHIPRQFTSVPLEYGPPETWRLYDLDLAPETSAALVINQKSQIRVNDLADFV